MAARKRRKIDDTTPTTECVAAIVSELDLEIALRRRVAETIESRITWALLLQDALKKEYLQPSILKSSQGSNGSTSSFKDVALDVASNIEAPLDVIFDGEIAAPPPAAPFPMSRPPRPPPRQKLLRNTNGRFLYIRSSSLEPPYDENHIRTYLLQCPQCLRQSFTALQGLLNHARLSHGTEWGTHDECVRACAVVDPDLDVEMGIEVGLGPNGILPGVRSLFQMAVGAHQTPESLSPHGVATGEPELPVESHSQDSNLNKTLGFHEDTPALAPFLGKQATRRGIKVWNEDETVDIESFGDSSSYVGVKIDDAPSSSSSSHLWKMSFMHRNNFKPEETASNDLDPNQASVQLFEKTLIEATDPSSRSGRNITGSRFHFRARISVVDRSLFIPPEKRVSSSAHSHQWMISVDAPSYSHHITTILKRLVVSSSNSNVPSLSTNKPPFLVVGQADEPFLAKIELHLSEAPGPKGVLADQIVHLEHWVELDLSKSSTPVIGDEQMVDLELDRGTTLLPIQKGYLPIGAKAHWSQANEWVPDNIISKPLKDYTDLLKTLVKKFPMTLDEVKVSRQGPPEVPYPLVSASELESFVIGRRKAIEWSRARFVQKAYAQQCLKGQFQTHDFLPLTTADVYSWLAAEGHFIRTSGTIKAEPEDVQGDRNADRLGVWYPTRDQRNEAQKKSPIKSENSPEPLPPDSKVKVEDMDSKDVLSKPRNQAQGRLDFPVVDISSRLHLSLGHAILPQRLHSPERHFTASDMVSACNPKQLLAVRNVVGSLKLTAFPFQSDNQDPLCLDVALGSYVRELVEGGLDSIQKQRNRSQKDMGKEVGESEGTLPCVALTPSHVISGVLARSDSPGSGPKLFDRKLYYQLPNHTFPDGQAWLGRVWTLCGRFPLEEMLGPNATRLNFFDLQGIAVTAADRGPLRSRNVHHRHHFGHHRDTLAASSTLSAVSSASRFTTSTIISPYTSSEATTTDACKDSLELDVSDDTTPDESEAEDVPSNEPNPPNPETPATTSSETSSTSEIAIPTLKSTTSSLTPNGNKAGIAGGDAYPFFKDYIGWWYDWTPNPSKPGKPIGVPMLWGGGTADPVDAARLAAFKKISTAPTYVLAYEEPDCPPGSGSAGMSVSAGVSGWERLIAPLGKKGSLLGSPSMCKQADETWLAQFGSKISYPWDFTAVHVNKNNLDGVKKDIDHYWNTYKKPIWVTEFACVNDKNGFVPCTNQDEINNFISVAVSYFESDSRVFAYAYSNGLGLGSVWPLMRGNTLSESGKAYLAAVRRYH
ncbi:hypothetical protein H0H93_000167 [Arthromyces matolae]|nr:hypothetical protein H0H93_000167 [Arthromyces matolae]